MHSHSATRVKTPIQLFCAMTSCWLKQGTMIDSFIVALDKFLNEPPGLFTKELHRVLNRRCDAWRARRGRAADHTGVDRDIYGGA
jgi:hypothetical protein